MFERLARMSVNHPRRVLAFWAALLLVCLPFAQRIGEVLTSEVGIAPDSRAYVVTQTIRAEFAGQEDSQLLLVADHVAPGRPVPAIEDARFAELLTAIGRVDGVTGVIGPQTDRLIPTFADSNRSSLALIAVGSRVNAEVGDVIDDIQALLPQDGAVAYYLTGGEAVARELQEISQQDATRAELIGIPISLLVLLFVFGAAVAATLPLLVAMASISMSMAVLFAIGQLFPIAAFAQIIVTMLGLATGIDYALLMVNRFREELEAGRSPKEAAFVTTLTAGKAVTFSGLTVLVALGALLVPPLAFVQSMGIACMTTMLFSVSVSVTALPALLTLLGHRVNWLRLSRRAPGTRSRSFWRQRARVVMRRPVAWTVFGLVVLLGLSVPALRMEVAFAGVRGLTADTSARSAHETLVDLGMEGLLHPFEVLIDFGERGFFHPSSVRAVSRFTRAANDLEAVAQVHSATTAGGLPPLMVTQYYASHELARESPLRDLVRATVSENGRYALVRIFPDATVMPAASELLAIDLAREAQELGLTAGVTGDYVIEQEWADTLYRSFPLAIALVYLVTFVLLGLAFHSLVLPIKSIILNTLTVGAAFGIVTLVFQEGFLSALFGVPQGLGFVETSVPLFIFAIVFGLSMDYEVFLVSRVVEGHKQGMTDREAIEHALSATGGVITSAALIMLIVFSVFLFSNVVLIKTLALGLTVAVLLDATLVRLALVPSMVLLAGRWNWWLPRPVKRIAERVDLSHD